MTSNENSLNYKVVEHVESYKFRIKFISIQLHTKKLRFFENRLTLTAMGHDGVALQPSGPTPVEHYSTCNRRVPWRFAPTVMGHDSDISVLLNFETFVYFCKINKK
jgi:hypothetical protein